MDLSVSLMEQLADDEGDLCAPRDPYKDEILMCGELVKLGGKRKSWRLRWITVRGNGMMEYYRARPSQERPLNAMTPAGVINLHRDCVEIMTYDLCDAIMRGAVDVPHSQFLTKAAWAEHATKENTFGIRTTNRIWLFYAPTGDSKQWVTDLHAICTKCELYEGVNITAIPTQSMPASPVKAGSFSLRRLSQSLRRTSTSASRRSSRNSTPSISRRTSDAQLPHTSTPPRSPHRSTSSPTQAQLVRTNSSSDSNAPQSHKQRQASAIDALCEDFPITGHPTDAKRSTSNHAQQQQQQQQQQLGQQHRIIEASEASTLQVGQPEDISSAPSLNTSAIAAEESGDEESLHLGVRNGAGLSLQTLTLKDGSPPTTPTTSARSNAEVA